MKEKVNFVQKEDVLKFISDKGVRILNLCHIPEDGRLKTLSFSTLDKMKVNEILEFGERVDGSSLFSYIDSNNSDIYITPKFDTAFLNPFSSEPSLNVLCKYLDQNGKPLNVTPENILHKAEQRLRSCTEIVLSALAELEFYIISWSESKTLFSSVPEQHYHESAPFSRFENLRNEILVTLADIGVATKYGHAEVGSIQGENHTIIEQHEIELALESFSRMAETIAVAKWVIRNVCARHGVTVSFSPKISLEHAGSGMHIHLCGLRNNKNIIENSDGNISTAGKKMIGGILKFAPSLTAFGNTVPVSYLRFFSRQESPISICWGVRNRLALIRIPLWWNFRKIKEEADVAKKTFEFRAPDASANAHLLLAGISIAIKYGFKHPKKALQIAEELHAETGKIKKGGFSLLPQSCVESAANLENDRKFYEADGIFPAEVIDGTIRRLRSYKDKSMLQRLKNEPRKIQDLIQTYLHCG